MTEHRNFSKLIQRFESLLSSLDKYQDHIIQQRLNKIHYQQRIEEMTLLLKQFEETKESLESLRCLIQESYTAGFHVWRKDICWLHTYLNQRERTKPIL